MPFVHHKHTPEGSHTHEETLQIVQKGIEDLTDPVLLQEIQALASAYGNVFAGLSRAATTARNAMVASQQIGNVDLRAFQEVFAREVVQNLNRSLVDVTDDVRQQVLVDAERAVQELPSSIRLQMSFNATDPRAIQWAQTRAGSLIKQIETEALTAVRGIIGEALGGQFTVVGAAQRISRVVGLHDRWQNAVDNLYDREFDRLQELFPDLSIDAIQELAEERALTYRQQLIDSRALTIARTEIIASQNTGQLISWLQASDNGLLDLNQAQKEWVTGPDGWVNINVCPVCLELGGQRVPVLSVFSNGEASPPAHPNCRCNMNLVVLTGLE
jgi:hypothetical protein